MVSIPETGVKTLNVRYGTSILRLSLKDVAGCQCIEPRFRPGVADERSAVLAALQSPINSLSLHELARGKHSATIVVSDVTRVTKSEVTVPAIVRELERAGLPASCVTVLFALGAHRAMTRAEQEALVGEVASHVQLVNHDGRAKSELVDVGSTSRGTPVRINSLFADAELRILTGAVNYHDFAGFSGGPKSVLPGIAAVQTIQANHALTLGAAPGSGIHPMAAIGSIAENPVHTDMVEAATLARPGFLVNVALNDRREIVQVVAGQWQAAHAEGRKTIAGMFRVQVGQPAHIVVASCGGFPRDVSFYQSVKALLNTERIVRRDGVVVLVAECREGWGHPEYLEWLTRGGPDAVEREMRAEFSIVGKAVFQLHTMLRHHRVIMVTKIVDQALESLGIRRANDLEHAFDLARAMVSTLQPVVALVPQAGVTFCAMAGDV